MAENEGTNGMDVFVCIWKKSDTIEQRVQHFNITDHIKCCTPDFATCTPESKHDLDV